MRILLVGDTHGDIVNARRVTAHAARQDVDVVLQVGDFGYWPRADWGKWFLSELEDACAATDVHWQFIDGNHEDHVVLHSLPMDESTGLAPVSEHLSFIPRCHRWVWDEVSFQSVSGAVSVDRMYRVEDETWFADEVLSPEQVDTIRGLGPVDVVVAHDVPVGVAFMDRRLEVDVEPGLRQAARLFPYKDLLVSDAHRRTLRGLFDTLQPKAWVHGHHHVAYEEEWMGCRIIGLGDNGTPIERQTLVLDTALID